MKAKDGISADAALFVGRLLTAGGISKLARELGVSPASISMKLSRLEQLLGVVLVSRSSSRWEPTPQGMVIGRAGLALEAELTAVRDWSSGGALEREWVRVCAPTGLARYVIGDILVDFSRQHPDVGLSVRFENAVDDLIQKEVDISLRVADSPPKSMIAHRLFSIPYVLCAAPGLLVQHRDIEHPLQLEETPFVGAEFVGKHHRVSGQHEHSKESVDLYITPTLQVSEFNVVKQATVQGIGFAFLPVYMVQEELRDGSLRELFTDWRFHPYGDSVFLLRLRERYVGPAVMQLSAFIRAECARREIPATR
ncbi:LysR family transcriptional regulator [Cupriavidus lacunae]|uniref:HTH lysR-type domain-containing protein n=1 Tax=Cupriavidus lacunae TaxID=2666307 RepID=A0A370P0S4_9BURK|nr:LysR family transcriptional regulator [Cupriavidus lacunae]RDK11464.1 hypothetical protein DN412_03620 [Cupriavidus lacunae]